MFALASERKRQNTNNKGDYSTSPMAGLEKRVEFTSSGDGYGREETKSVIIDTIIKIL